MRSIRAPACGWAGWAGSDRVRHPPSDRNILRDVRAQRARVPDLLRHAGVDPAARIAGRNADPQTLQQVRHDFGLDRPKAVQYAIMMKKLFITRDLTSFVNRGAEVIPQITDAAPVTLSLVFGAAFIWVVVGDRHGHGRGGHARHGGRPVTHGDRADRHLDAGLLAGRGGQPDHAEPPPRRAVLLAAAARLHADHGGSRALVQAPDLPVAHALGGLHRALRARAAREHGRHAERGFRAHGPREGHQRAARAAPPRPAQLDDRVRQPPRSGLRRARRRRRAAHRGRLRAARASAS